MRLRKKSSPISASRPLRAAEKSVGFDFSALVDAIQRIHQQSASTASRAVNIALTLRNWAIGFYIREYEQNGDDRAKYGASVLDKLAKRLNKIGNGELTPRYLRLCRYFADSYPSIGRSVTANSQAAYFSSTIWRSLTAKFTNPSGNKTESTGIDLHLPAEKLLETLSFTHFEHSSPSLPISKNASKSPRPSASISAPTKAPPANRSKNSCASPAKPAPSMSSSAPTKTKMTTPFALPAPRLGRPRPVIPTHTGAAAPVGTCGPHVRLCTTRPRPTQLKT